MLGKNTLRKFVTAMNAVAVLTVYSMVALAVPGDVTGEITVSGQVTVNGQSAVSNSTIVSGSSVATGAASSATVNLGKAGRVELLENTNATINFSERDRCDRLIRKSSCRERCWRRHDCHDKGRDADRRRRTGKQLPC